jgi:hypothetical protein
MSAIIWSSGVATASTGARISASSEAGPKNCPIAIAAGRFASDGWSAVTLIPSRSEKPSGADGRSRWKAASTAAQASRPDHSSSKTDTSPTALTA